MTSHSPSIRLIEFISLCLLLVSACSSMTAPPMPELGIPTEKYNTQLKLDAPAGWNSFKTNASVTLTIEVIGQSNIAFDPRAGIVLLVLQDDQWVEVPNLTQYPGVTESIVYLPTNESEFRKGSVGVSPILTDYDRPITLRVVVLGKIAEDVQGTDEQVGGYIDVFLKP